MPAARQPLITPVLNRIKFTDVVPHEVIVVNVHGDVVIPPLQLLSRTLSDLPIVFLIRVVYLLGPLRSTTLVLILDYYRRCLYASWGFGISIRL